MARRESLAIFVAVYDFMRVSRNLKTEIPDEVRKELQWARALLPALVADIWAGWDSTLTVSDSSLEGFGVCERKMDPNKLLKLVAVLSPGDT